jgi:hypothetical protein
MVVGRHNVHKVNCKFVAFCVFRCKGFYLKGVDTAPVLGGGLVLFCLVLPGIILH